MFSDDQNTYLVVFKPADFFIEYTNEVAVNNYTESKYKVNLPSSNTGFDLIGSNGQENGVSSEKPANSNFQGTGTILNVDLKLNLFTVVISGFIKTVRVGTATSFYSKSLTNIQWNDIRSGHTVRIYGSLGPNNTILGNTIYDDSL